MTPARKAILLHATWLALSAPAFGQDFSLSAPPQETKAPPLFSTSMIEIGLGYQSQDSFFFGRYSGLTDRGFFAIADAEIDIRDPWNSGDTRFLRIEANDLGLSSRFIRATYGRQGSWRADLYFDGFDRYYTNTAVSPYLGLGTAHLTLPPNWAASGTTAGFASFGADQHRIALDVERLKAGADVVFDIDGNYSGAVHFWHEHRDGLKSRGVDLGPNSLTDAAVFVPEVVDYDTDRAETSLAFVGEQTQWRVSYIASIFTDRYDGMTIQTPFSSFGGTPFVAGAQYPTGLAQISLPPSNSAQQVRGDGTYVVSPMLRLTGNFAFGVEMQNDPFLPYTGNALLSAPIPLPRASADALVLTELVNLSASLRPSRALDIFLNLTYDNRDNQTPRDLYLYIVNDSQLQPQSVISQNARLNMPYSLERKSAKLDIGYRLPWQMKLNLSYDGDAKNYTFSQVSYVGEQSGRFRLAKTFESGSASLSYLYGERRGSQYVANEPFVDSRPQAVLNLFGPNIVFDHPLARKFFLADRNRNEAKAAFDTDLAPGVALSLSGSFAYDDYFRSVYGLHNDASAMVDTDLSWTVSRSLKLDGFYSLEAIRSSQASYFFTGISLTNPDQAWRASNRDLVHSAGLTATWTAIPDKLSFKFEAQISYDSTRIKVLTEPFNAATLDSALPDVVSNMASLGVNGEYSVSASLALHLGYQYQHYRNSDFAYLNVVPTALAQILTSGELLPHYDIHLGMFSVRYRF